MPEKKNQCLRCGKQLTPQKGRGRPRKFCSEFCRRRIEAERERLLRRLEGFEEALTDALVAPLPVGIGYGCCMSNPEVHKDHLRESIRATEELLRQIGGIEDGGDGGAN